MRVSLTRLRHIVAVARTGSFSLAAEEEAISQPALSRSIQIFEGDYGVRLFDRDRSGARLTPAGAVAVDMAKGVLAAAGELDRGMALIGAGEAGRIGVGFGPLLASVLLPGLGRDLLGTSPGVQLVSRIGPPDQLIGALQDGTIEAILANSWHLSQVPGVEQHRIGRLELAMAVRAGHPLAGTARLTMADLQDYPVAGAIEAPAGFAAGQPGGLVSDNFHILREVVTETDCVWLTSPLFIARDLAEGRLVRLAVADLEPAGTDIWAAFRRGRTRSPMLDRVIGHVEEMLDAGSPRETSPVGSSSRT